MPKKYSTPVLEEQLIGVSPVPAVLLKDPQTGKTVIRCLGRPYANQLFIVLKDLASFMGFGAYRYVDIKKQAKGEIFRTQVRGLGASSQCYVLTTKGLARVLEKQGESKKKTVMALLHPVLIDAPPDELQYTIWHHEHQTRYIYFDKEGALEWTSVESLFRTDHRPEETVPLMTKTSLASYTAFSQYVQQTFKASKILRTFLLYLKGVWQHTKQEVEKKDAPKKEESEQEIKQPPLKRLRVSPLCDSCWSSAYLCVCGSNRMSSMELATPSLTTEQLLAEFDLMEDEKTKEKTP